MWDTFQWWDKSGQWWDICPTIQAVKICPAVSCSCFRFWHPLSLFRASSFRSSGLLLVRLSVSNS